MDHTGTFTDNRGAIIDLVVEPVDAVTIVEFKDYGTVRGNHFHKKTTQWNYLIEGQLDYFTPASTKLGVLPHRMKVGELIKTEPGVPHAFQGRGKLLVITKGPRRGTDFDKDTYHLAKPLIE